MMASVDSGQSSQPGQPSEELHEALERLAGAVAHDLGNALTVIRSCTAALLRAAEAGQPAAGDDLVQLAAAAARAEELTRHLAAFARRRRCQATALDLNEVVERARAELARLVGDGVELVLDLAVDLQPARADAEQLTEALRCLVDNARQALPRGGRVRISTATLPLLPGDPAWPTLAPGPHVRLEVQDDGVGMSAEVQAGAFDPLFTTRRSGRGVGLGLAIAEGIARGAGGAIRIDSAPGRGTRVTLALPRGEAPVARAPAPVSVGGTESILLVEGDTRLRGLMLRALAGAGYEVHLAGDAGEALRSADALARPPRLLLAELPASGRADGDLADALGCRWPDLRVLYTASHADDRRGPANVLAKPFSPGELLAEVRAVLDEPAGATSARPGGRGDPV
jgi:two-component system cell cycle sensor histidine kinase/response regulator CckA